jgi:hypothetical protein
MGKDTFHLRSANLQGAQTLTVPFLKKTTTQSGCASLSGKKQTGFQWTMLPLEPAIHCASCHLSSLDSRFENLYR